MTHRARFDPQATWTNRITGMLVVAGLLLTPSSATGRTPDRADGEGSSSPSARPALTAAVVDVPAPWFWDEMSGQRVGARANRFELDDPGRAAGMSVWFSLAYVPGGDRLNTYEHTSPSTLGPDSVIAQSQNVAWHVAMTLLGRRDGVARPGEIPDWAIARTGNNDGRSAGLLFALAYIDLLTPGALAGDLRIAATGAIASGGRITPVRFVDAKLAAARLTNPDVVFAPSFPAGSGHAVVGSSDSPQTPGQGVGEWLDTAAYEAAGRLAATAPGVVALVPVDDVRQALAWLCGRTQRPATCDLAHDAAAEPIADARPQPSAPAAPARGQA